MERKTYSATHNGTTTAELTASYTDRDKIRAYFWCDMLDENDEFNTLVTSLFDRYGLLWPEYYNHPVLKGTGVWGEELGEGGIVVFEKLCVKQPGSAADLIEGSIKVINHALESLKSRYTNFIAFIRPEVTSDDLLAISVHVWRSAGFRRVGTTYWFAFTPNPDHPSRKLDASEDYEFPQVQPDQDTMPDHVHALFEMLGDYDSLDDVCLGHLQVCLPEADDPAWLMTNEAGDTLLHAASFTSKPECIRYIIFQKPALLVTRNHIGHTPAEAMRNELDYDRSMQEAEDDDEDEFTGFSEEDVRSLALLMDWRVPDIMGFKFGCTCGDCAWGFLSPRMRERLSLVARRWSDPNDNPPEVAKFMFVPDELQRSMANEHGFKHGFAKLYQCLHLCFETRRAPTAKNVMSMKAFLGSRDDRKSVVVTLQRFAEAGEDAADIVTNAVLFEVIANDTVFGFTGEPYRVEHDKSDLPKCRNDREYGLVRRLCRIKDRLPVGFD